MKAVYDMATQGRRMSSGCSCVMAVCYRGAAMKTFRWKVEAGYEVTSQPSVREVRFGDGVLTAYGGRAEC